MCPTDPVAGPGDRAGVPLAKRDGSRDTGEHIGESSLRLVQAADIGPHPRSSREGEQGGCGQPAAQRSTVRCSGRGLWPKADQGLGHPRGGLGKLEGMGEREAPSVVLVGLLAKTGPGRPGSGQGR